MATTSKSPKISHISWGKVRVDGQDVVYKDVKLWPGGSREWDWNETGTSHSPGIQPDDVRELLEHGATRIVLSRGMIRRLQVKDKTLDWLSEQGVSYDVLPTKQAAEAYNRCAENEPVGALIHSTC